MTAVHSAKAGHPGGSLSAADILTLLYFDEMDIDPKEPKKANRDRFVLSKGHVAPGLYSALAYRGYFPVEDLNTFRHLGSYLQGHPEMKHISGVDMSSGSLGQGISVAVGMALAAKLDGKSYKTYVLCGDGEIQEGQIWEAAMFAGHKRLDNLVVIIDNNGLQIDGKIEEVCSPYPIDKKFEAFNFHVITTDAHDFDALRAAFKEAKETKGMPTAIIARSIKGKGVSFMENRPEWHGTAPNDEQYKIAVATGICVCQAMEAADMLQKDKISTKVINIHTIKPIDEGLIIEAAKETGKIVTVEEHSVIGGLGSAVCDVLSEKLPTLICKIGIMDMFGESGTAEGLIKKYGLDAQGIYDKVKKFLSMEM